LNRKNNSIIFTNHKGKSDSTYSMTGGLYLNPW
jgi:hypothetical protein